jgi:hypothetical protein
MKRLLLLAAVAAISTGSMAAAPEAAPPSPEALAKSAIETRQGLYKVMGSQMQPLLLAMQRAYKHFRKLFPSCSIQTLASSPQPRLQR